MELEIRRFEAPDEVRTFEHGSFELVMEPRDLFAIPPGHDSWVVGDEPYVSLHFEGYEEK